MASRHSVAAAATPDGASAVDQPAEKAVDPKPEPSAPAKRTRTAQPKTRTKTSSTTAKKASSKASAAKTPAEASQGSLGDAMGSLLDEAEADAQGTVQVAVRLSPRTKKRLRASMTRAGLVQEKFIAFLIEQGLDELDKTLAAREADEK